MNQLFVFAIADKLSVLETEQMLLSFHWLHLIFLN